MLIFRSFTWNCKCLWIIIISFFKPGNCLRSPHIHPHTHTIIPCAYIHLLHTEPFTHRRLTPALKNITRVDIQCYFSFVNIPANMNAFVTSSSRTRHFFSSNLVVIISGDKMTAGLFHTMLFDTLLPLVLHQSYLVNKN